jgi:tRNA1(Val) A37 N6-methylase TrmN6
MTASGEDERGYRGWVRPGPIPPGGIAVSDDETLDYIGGHWRIFQLKKGHRYSTDDVVCAHYASQWAPRVERYCDLGAGIGSVALLVAWRLPGCTVLTVEAQPVSVALQEKSIRYNGVAHRFTTKLGDLRDDEPFVGEGAFDLVTGSPPYWATSDALPSAHEQAVPARLEVRGTIVDYARRARSLLAPGGVFACVFQAAQDERVRRALDDAELALVRTRAIRFKPDVEASASGARVYIAARREDLPGGWRRAPVEEPPLTTRTATGDVDPEYAAVRLSFGFPPGG